MGEGERRDGEVRRALEVLVGLSVEELAAAVRDLPPVAGARLAAVLADRRLSAVCSSVAAERTVGLTRAGGGELSREEVAGLLGVGVPAVARRIRLRNAGVRGSGTRSGKSDGSA